jgi:DHA1 family multidrug resistance protein-like MFS transporter
MSGFTTRPVRSEFSPFLLLCGLGLFAIFSSTMSKSPVLPLFAQHLGASKADIGFIAAASTIIGIVTNLPAGALSDVWGRKRVILIAALVFASAPFLYFFVTTPWQLVVVRVYHGLATAIFGPVALAYVADLFQQRRGENMAWYSSATMVGRFLAPTVGGFVLSLATLPAIVALFLPLGLPQQRLPYLLVYLGCGLSGLVALLLALRLPDLGGGAEVQRGGGGDHASTPADEKRRPRPYLERRILLTSGMEAAQYLAYGALETFLPLYALAVGLAEWEIGLIFGLQTVTTLLTKPIMGRLSDRLGRRTLIALGLLVSAAALAAVPWTASMLLLAVLAMLFGLGVAVVTSSTAAFVADLAHGMAHGAALGTLGTIMDVGHASGPIIAGLLIARFSYAPAFAIIAVVLILAAGGFLTTVK